MREKEGYRDNLERVLEAFPGREVLKPAEVARWLHMDPKTVRKAFPFKPHFGISVATLARCLNG